MSGGGTSEMYVLPVFENCHRCVDTFMNWTEKFQNQKTLIIKCKPFVKQIIIIQ